MYVRSNQIDINFHVPEVHGVATTYSRCEVVRSYFNSIKPSTFGYKLLLLSCNETLPKKHSNKRTIEIDEDGNIVDNRLI